MSNWRVARPCAAAAACSCWSLISNLCARAPVPVSYSLVLVVQDHTCTAVLGILVGLHAHGQYGVEISTAVDPTCTYCRPIQIHP